MCGIVGLISQHADVVSRLLEGLSRLEYRGYDSAGIATIAEGVIQRRRAQGKLAQLLKAVEKDPLIGKIGIGHTRWATHGIPSLENAHPQGNHKIAVVHNGIIENFVDLRKNLEKQGHIFESQTDTEVVVHLLTNYLIQGHTPLEAVQASLERFEGAFALALLFSDYPTQLFVVRRGSPLVIGYGEGEMAIGSDASAVAPWAQTLCYLEEGDYACISPDGATIYDSNAKIANRPTCQVNGKSHLASKAGYQHYMLKEIFEQPTALQKTFEHLIEINAGSFFFKNSEIEWKNLNRLMIVACGTSYYAAMVAKYWFEKLAHLPVEVDIASEFRYRQPLLSQGSLILFISQSGETIDTLAALQLVKAQKKSSLALVNVLESSIARQAEKKIQTQAGPEVGVASTKAFTSQLMVLACLALKAAMDRKTLVNQEIVSLLQALEQVPVLLQKFLSQANSIQSIASSLMHTSHALYIGRGTNYPIALEGALKLKEISYIHATGYPAGELKHGPIALVDATMPVVVVAPADEWFSKMLSNIQEVIARSGQVIIFTDTKGHSQLNSLPTDSLRAIVTLPMVHSFVAPLLYSLPMQLLAYYTAASKGTDVDQPRNLAKSVTVE